MLAFRAKFGFDDFVDARFRRRFRSRLQQYWRFAAAAAQRLGLEVRPIGSVDRHKTEQTLGAFVYITASWNHDAHLRSDCAKKVQTRDRIDGQAV
jgi:hypothetical protein